MEAKGVERDADLEASRLDRLAALLLGLASGGFWILFGITEIVGPALTFPNALGFGLLLFISSLIAWQWEAFGGLLLLFEGIFAIYLILLAGFPLLLLFYLILTLGLPACTTGILFLLGWLEEKAKMA